MNTPTLAPTPMTELLDELYDTIIADLARFSAPDQKRAVLRLIMGDAIYAALENTGGTQSACILQGMRAAGVQVEPTLLLELERRGERYV